MQSWSRSIGSSAAFADAGDAISTPQHERGKQT
jgi:hypothetical protein